jgi:glutaconate CoA-transferase subunit A
LIVERVVPIENAHDGTSRRKWLNDAEEIVPLLKDGMTIGIGGFGLDRKPMTIIRAIARSDVKDLTIASFAGALDIEMLVAAGKVRCVSACHVGLDHFGLAPLFRAARESAAIQFEEWSEWTQLAAWRAAAEGVPCAITTMDPKSELLRVNPHIKMVRSHFSGRPVCAVEAPHIDLALLHAEAAHPDGWAVARGDRYLDTILARASDQVVLSTERLMDDEELERRFRDVHLLASYVDAMLLAPRGAEPGSLIPNHLVDFERIQGYVQACAEGRDATAYLTPPRGGSTL